MFIVWTKFWETSNKGTANEFRHLENFSHRNGPFESREAAELFARNIATADQIGTVEIEEVTE